jgi:hypothetical protein
MRWSALRFMTGNSTFAIEFSVQIHAKHNVSIESKDGYESKDRGLLPSYQPGDRVGTAFLSFVCQIFQLRRSQHETLLGAFHIFVGSCVKRRRHIA